MRKTVFALVIAILACPAAFADDVTDVEQWLDSQPQPIALDYTTVCDPLVTSGSQKYGCRVKDQPQAGLLICKDPGCNPLIATETAALQDVESSGLPAIEFINKVYPFQCKGASGKTCNGYIVRWYGPEEGEFFKPTRSGADPLIIAAQNLGKTNIDLQIQTCIDMKAYWASWVEGKAIGDFQGVLVFATGQFLTADPTKYPSPVIQSQKKTLQRVCNSICQKSWGQCQ